MNILHQRNSEVDVLTKYFVSCQEKTELLLKKIEEVPLRIRALRTLKDPNSKLPYPITLKTMAVYLKDNYSNMARYEAYEKDYFSYPKYSTLIELAALFGVTTDYLITGRFSELAKADLSILKEDQGEYKTSGTDKATLESQAKEIQNLRDIIASKEETIELYKKLVK